MGNSRFKKFDRQRYRKTYDLLRVVPSYSYKSSQETLLETVDVAFANQTEKAIVLTEKYSGLPTVIATSRPSTAEAGEANINVYVKSIEIENKNVTITLATSAAFTGVVAIQSIYIGGG